MDKEIKREIKNMNMDMNEICFKCQNLWKVMTQYKGKCIACLKYSKTEQYPLYILRKRKRSQINNLSLTP